MVLYVYLDISMNTRGRPPLVLVITPTRELANQVKAEFDALSQGLSVFCIYGGVPYEPQGMWLHCFILILLNHINLSYMYMYLLVHVLLRCELSICIYNCSGTMSMYTCTVCIRCMYNVHLHLNLMNNFRNFSLSWNNLWALKFLLYVSVGGRWRMGGKGSLIFVLSNATPVVIALWHSCKKFGTCTYNHACM